MAGGGGRGRGGRHAAARRRGWALGGGRRVGRRGAGAQSRAGAPGGPGPGSPRPAAEARGGREPAAADALPGTPPGRGGAERSGGAPGKERPRRCRRSAAATAGREVRGGRGREVRGTAVGCVPRARVRRVRRLDEACEAGGAGVGKATAAGGAWRRGGRWQAVRGSPDVFEGTAKTLLLGNCGWGRRTVVTFEKLCEWAGGNSPLPAQIAGVDEAGPRVSRRHAAAAGPRRARGRACAVAVRCRQRGVHAE